MNDYGAIVIGAGVVGLATARALVDSGRSVLVLERAGSFGTGTSSRNSEVIHAGIYYPSCPLKARLCVEGRQRLYRYCAERGIPHRAIGKLIVATREAHFAGLERIQSQALRAGVTDLRMIDQAELRGLEPELAGIGGLFSPQTGIIDSHAYMLALIADIEAGDGQIAYHSAVEGLRRTGDGWAILIEGERDPVVTAGIVVNAAGLDAAALAGRIEGLGTAHRPMLRYARGQYLGYAGRVPFRHLVYPLPVPGGLGVHLTLDLNGQARFGPNVEWIDAIDYSLSDACKPAFLDAIRDYWPAIDAERLNPSFCGIRPKLVGPGEPDADFRIDGEGEHGLPGLINLFGIESPGLTSSLAIAEEVIAKLDRAGAPALAAVG